MNNIQNKIKLYHSDRSNTSLRDQIFQDNYQYIKKLVTNFNKKYNYRYEQEDLQQYAALGLLRAIQLFKGTNNSKFTTYAYIKCIGAMLDGLKKQNKGKISKILQLLEKSANIIRQKQGRQPNLDQIIMISTLSDKQINQVKYHYQPKSQQSQFDSVLDEFIAKQEKNEWRLND